MRLGFARCLGCDGLNLVDLDVLQLQLARRHEKRGVLIGNIAFYTLLGSGMLIGIVNAAAPVILGGWIAWGGFILYNKLFRPRFHDRRLYRHLVAGTTQPQLAAGARTFTGRAAGAELRAPLSRRPAVVVRHDVIVHGAAVAHCTSGSELVATGDATVRVFGPLALESGEVVARKGQRGDAVLMIDGATFTLAALKHAFGERALIEERIVNAGESIEVTADGDLIEDLAEASADAYRTAAVTVIHGRPGHPVRVTRPAD